MSVAIEIINRTRRRIDTRWLFRQLRKLLKLQGVNTGAWSMTIVGDKEMAALHKRTMNNPSTTDVLTFDMGDSPRRRIAASPRPIDLDTVICGDVAARQAKDLGHSANHELLLYALHSLLHVQGYDDRSAVEFDRMHRREDSLLIASGLRPIYKTQNRTRSVSEGREKHRIRNRKSKIENRK